MKQTAWPIIRRLCLSLLTLTATLALFVSLSPVALADTTRVSDPAQVLDVQQVISEGSKLSYPLDIYTTNTFSGTSTDFAQRTISAHLISKKLIVIAIDTVHRYLAIVGGSQVPLKNADYTTAGQAFKGAVSGNHYTDAVIAAIHSLASSLHIGGSSGGTISGPALFIILGIVILLIIVGIVVRVVKRMLGIPTAAPVVNEPNRNGNNYGDGRDNFGGGAAGDF